MGRRGPKRQVGKRERNGQLSRRPEDVAARNIEGLDLEQRAMISVGVAARERIWKDFGVTPQNSRDQMAGSFVGRLCMTREISQRQYEAAITWLSDCHSNASARGVRPARAINLNATRGSADLPENVGRTIHSVARYEKAREAVQAKQEELHLGANLFGALNLCVEQDIALHHLVGDLRYALNALARHYKLGGREPLARKREAA